MPTMVGEARVFSIDGTLAFTGAATTTNGVQGVSIEDAFDTAEARGIGNNVKTRCASNRRHTISIQIMWKDADGTPTQAGAKSNIGFPAPLAKVTLASFGTASIDGDWNYEGGSAELKLDGYASGTFRLSRYGDTPAAMNAVT